jgi:YidC/Oxa1 family membrane protein insertase
MTPIAIMPQPVVDLANSILRFFHDSIGLSWGFSIIALTVTVRLIILPLTFKQVRGMQELQLHAPELKKIQERYADDRERKNQATLEYYKEHKVNPLSSCLPLVLQIPVFITLFDLLRGTGFSKEIAGEEGFLFVQNLAGPATGVVLVVLMVLYVGTQLGSSMVSMVSAEKSQRRIMLVLPFVFVPVVIGFRAGLIVYWITTNLWTVGQQLAVKRFLPSPAMIEAKEKKDAAKAAKAGAAPNGTDANPVAAGATNGRNGGSGAPKALAERTSNGSGNGQAQKAPPPPPRKKKKRSGRRR